LHDLFADEVDYGLHRIEQLIRQNRLKHGPASVGCRLGEWQGAAVAPNVLDHAFVAPAPNRRWSADFTTSPSSARAGFA